MLSNISIWLPGFQLGKMHLRAGQAHKRLIGVIAFIIDHPRWWCACLGSLDALPPLLGSGNAAAAVVLPQKSVLNLGVDLV